MLFAPSGWCLSPAWMSSRGSDYIGYLVKPLHFCTISCYIVAFVFDPWHSCWTTSKLKDCLEFALMPQNSESTGIICLRVGLCICFLARRWRDWGSLGEFWNKDECAFLHFVAILKTFITIFEIVQLCDRTELRKILEFCWIVYIIGFEPNTMRYNNIATVCEKKF